MARRAKTSNYNVKTKKINSRARKSGKRASGGTVRTTRRI